MLFGKEKGFFQVGEQRFCDQVRMIQRKGWLSHLHLEKIKRLIESGENNVEALQDVKNRTGTGTIQKGTEQYIAQTFRTIGKLRQY